MSADLQTQIEAGYLTNDGKLTDEGRLTLAQGHYEAELDGSAYLTARGKELIAKREAAAAKK